MDTPAAVPQRSVTGAGLETACLGHTRAAGSVSPASSWDRRKLPGLCRGRWEAAGAQVSGKDGAGHKNEVGVGPCRQPGAQ